MSPSSPDPRDIDPRSPSAAPKISRPPKSNAPPAKTAATPATPGPFGINSAFFILEHLQVMLDLNFAAALADHILTNGSENRAVMAFGHQLAKVSSED